MFDNISNSNPFNAPFKAFKAASNTKINTTAKELFKDRKFSEEYKTVYYISRTLQTLASIVSASTFFIAIYLILEARLGPISAGSIGVITCVLIELLKAFLWRICSKGVQKYNEVSTALISVLVAMHIISGLGSIEGARRSGNLTPNAVIISASKVNIDSISLAHAKKIESIDLMIIKLTSNTRSKALKVLSSLNEQKVNLTAQHVETIKQAKAHNVEADAIAKTQSEEAQLARAEQTKTNTYITIIAAAFFEVLFVLCSLFCTYFLFRAYVDLHAETSAKPSRTAAVTAKASKEVTKAKADIKEPTRAPIGFTKNEVGNLETCAHLECSAKFKKIVWNKKYCSEECKISAWQQRKGKTFVPKKR